MKNSRTKTFELNHRNYFEKPDEEQKKTASAEETNKSNKGSILKRLAAKFSPKMSKKSPNQTQPPRDETHEPLEDEDLDIPQNVPLDDGTIKSHLATHKVLVSLLFIFL